MTAPFLPDGAPDDPPVEPDPRFDGRSSDDIFGSDAMEAAMNVFKWDDDLAVVLPEELVEQMGLSEGDELRIVEVVDRTLFVEKVDERGDGFEHSA